MLKSILSITSKFSLALIVVLALSGISHAQTTTVRGGNGAANIAEVKAAGLAGTEKGLVVRCASGCTGSGGTASSFAAAFPATGTAAGFSDGTNMVGARTYDSDSGGGTENTLGVNIRAAASGGSVGIPGDATNGLWVNCKTGCSGTSFSDNGAFTFGTSSVSPIAGVFDDTATNTATENSAAIVRITTQKALHINLRNVSGTEIGTSGSPIRVDPTGTTTQPINVGQVGGASVQSAANALNSTGGGIASVQPTCQLDVTTPTATTENQFGNVRCSSIGELHSILRDAAGNARGANVNASNELTTSANTELPAAAALADATANPTVPAVGSFNMCWNGTTWDRCTKGTSGNGAVDSSTQRVTIASDSTGTVIATQTTAANLNVRPDTSGATGAAPPARANYIGGLGSGATGGFLIGSAVADTFVNVNVSTATTTLLVTGVSGRHVRITSLNLVTAGANNVALISGTGATCGTGTTGMTGGTTAASGWNFAANGGIAQGTGLGTINQTNATGDSVCVVTSAATQLSGRLSYAIY